MKVTHLKYSFFILCITAASVSAQTLIEYDISFPNAVHHEAEISVTFRDIKTSTLEVSMSRSSPGRYAIHEFAKNVYAVKAVDSKGKSLTIMRPDPYQWNISGHDGTVTFSYILFGDHADGTYSQIDETHAHMNMPATFVFAREMAERPISITFNIRSDLGWKVATQLKPVNGNTYHADNLQYFMDSPTEISPFEMREFTEKSNGKSYTIRIALHQPGNPSIVDTMIGNVKKIVAQQKAVMGSLPDFDYGTYTFLACYMPQNDRDGMEHRNSTYVCGNFPLDGGGLQRAYSTMSHEFFHCWNVERIRPASLQPFDFERANMSGELWFAEGFTNYYTDLILCRAGLISEREYVSQLSGALNYIMLSPARAFRTPVEMSYYAPFADAATSVDPMNSWNTFISYYSYGEVLGLALDLSLRNLKLPRTLDDFMAYMWTSYGKPEKPYSVKDIQTALSVYVGETFANEFFDRYIYKSDIPDFRALLESVGVSLIKAAPGKAYFGASLNNVEKGIQISDYTAIGSPAYNAGLEKFDIIKQLNGKVVESAEAVEKIVSTHKPGDKISISFERHGKIVTTTVNLDEQPVIKTVLNEGPEIKADKEVLKRRNAWLEPK